MGILGIQEVEQGRRGQSWLEGQGESLGVLPAVLRDTTHGFLAFWDWSCTAEGQEGL